MQWLTLGKWCCPLSDYPELAMGQSKVDKKRQILKVCELYNNKYMITSALTNTETVAFITVLVFKLLSWNVLLIKRKDNKNR